MGKENEEDPEQYVKNMGNVRMESGFLSINVLNDCISCIYSDLVKVQYIEIRLVQHFYINVKSKVILEPN
jgi:hypothetical protein